MASAPTVIQGDVHIAGKLSANTLSVPLGAVTNAGIAGDAAIAASKLQHQFRDTHSQESGTTAAAESRVIAVAQEVGELVAIQAGAVVANIGDSTVTVDLHVNGSTVLDSVITLTSADADYAVTAGTINSAVLAAADVVEVIIAVAAGTGTLATGVFVVVEGLENS